MKINPPKAIIGKEDPFEYTLFGRKEFAESLTSLLRNVEENLVIFVNAPWGEGKTTFAEMWRAQLKQRNLDVIYFDAYAADYFDDPFVSFSGEILELADKHIPGGKELSERQEFKETAVEVGKRLAGLAIKVGFRAALLGAVESSDLEAVKEIITGASEIGSDVIEKKIENYGVEKDALKKFKESLEKLAAKVREKQKFPLTIIVDELDRVVLISHLACWNESNISSM
jgi:predicted KAP-like P-loop ATPase